MPKDATAVAGATGPAKSTGVTREAAPPKPYGELTPTERATFCQGVAANFAIGLIQCLDQGADTFCFDPGVNDTHLMMVMIRRKEDAMAAIKAIEVERAQEN